MHLSRALVLGRRWAAILGFAFMLYAVVGSVVFGEWWYGFFYDSGYKSAAYIWNGLKLLRDNFLPLMILAILALSAAVAAGARRKQRLFDLADRFADIIILVAIFGIIGDAIVLYRIPPKSPEMQLSAASHTFRFANGRVTVGPPAIEPPIYFYYLDISRVDALYNQIESELEEKERIVASSRGVKGTAEAGIEGSKVGIQAEKGTNSKSTFALAADFPAIANASK